MQNPSLKVALRVALVTGANRGLGKEVSRQLAENGFTVIMTARNVPVETRHALSLRLDVTNPSDIDAIFEFVKNEFGHLDVLINNAGILNSAKDTTEVSREEIQQTLDTNFFGPFLLSQRMIPLLEKSPDGRIVNVSSSMAKLEDAGSGHAAYRISKTALNALTAVMAADLRTRGIKVMTVDPGWVHTDMGGANAPRTPKKGAASIVWPALNDAESGKFYRDGEVTGW